MVAYFHISFPFPQHSNFPRFCLPPAAVPVPVIYPKGFPILVHMILLDGIQGIILLPFFSSEFPSLLCSPLFASYLSPSITQFFTVLCRYLVVCIQVWRFKNTLYLGALAFPSLVLWPSSLKDICLVSTVGWVLRSNLFRPCYIWDRVVVFWDSSTSHASSIFWCHIFYVSLVPWWVPTPTRWKLFVLWVYI